MGNVSILLAGELQRLRRYNILTGGFVVSLLWVAALHFLQTEYVESLFTLLLFVDIATMPAILVAVGLFYERDEGSLRAMLVTPIKHGEYIATKIVATVFSSLITLVILYGYAHFVRGIDANVLWLMIAVILGSGFHTLLGLLLTYGTRDFTGMLMRFMVYALVAMVPTLLEHVGVITHVIWRILLYLSPARAVAMLFQAAVTEVALGDVIFSIVFLVVGGGILYRVALVGFASFAQKQGGV